MNTKSEVEKTATKVFNGLIFLSNHFEGDRQKVLKLVAERLYAEGFDSIAQIAEAASNSIG